MDGVSNVNTADEKIVSIKFDNREFEKNVAVTINSIAALKESLKMNEAAAGLSELNTAFKGVDTSKLTKSLDAVKVKFSAIQYLMLQGISQITNKAVSGIKRTLDTFTTKPIKDGFAEYELKMGSVQTIMNSSGATLQEVTGYLDELNHYADKTIYSFSDMTSSIGKFTNAGVDLKTAVKAIQGVSNAAAYAGANSQQASSAMYNFSQALSTGYLGMMDYKSIELAGMATEQFKKTLTETAMEMGTLTFQNGRYVSTTTNANGAVTSFGKNMEGFRDSLQGQWITADVLVKTLGKYSDETTKLGKKSFAAAQDIKTFTQMMDTLKEAAGSGWAQTWELIIGDYESAKRFWTNLGGVLSDFIGQQADARNKMIQGWKQGGGLVDIFKALKNVFTGLSKLLKPIEKAFRDIFPKRSFEETSATLVNISRTIKAFTKDLMLTKEQSKLLRDTFRGVFAVLDLLKTGVQKLLGLIPKFDGDGILTSVLKITASIGDFLVAVRDTIKYGDSAAGALLTVKNGIITVAGVIKSLFTTVVKFISTIDVKDIADFIPPSLAGNIIKVKDNLLKLIPVLKKYFDIIKNKASSAFSSIASSASKLIPDNFNTIIQNAKKVLGSFGQKALEVGKIIGGAIYQGIRLVAGACLYLFNTIKTGIESVDWNKIKKTISDIFGIFVEGFNRFKSQVHGNEIITSFTNLFGTLGEIVGNFVQFMGTTVPNGINSFLKVIGHPLKSILDLLDPIIQAFKKLGGPISEAVNSGISKLAGTLSGGVLNVINGAFNLLNVTLNAVFHPLETIKSAFSFISGLLKQINESEFFAQVTKMFKTLIIGGLGVSAIQILQELKEVLRAYKSELDAKALMMVAGAVGILAGSLALLTLLDPGKHAGALVSIVTLMGAAVMAFNKLAKMNFKDLHKGILGIVVMASAVGILASATYKLGQLDFTQMTVGVMGIAALLTELVIFAKHFEMAKTEDLAKTAVGMILMSKALQNIAEAVAIIGGNKNMDETKMLVAAGAIAVLMRAVSKFAIELNNMMAADSIGSFMKIGVNMIALGKSIKVMAEGVVMLAKVPVDQLAAGIGAVVGVLLALYGFITGDKLPDPKDFKEYSKSFILISLAMKVIASAIKQVGEIPWPQMLIGMGAIMLLIATMGIMIEHIGNNATALQSGAAFVGIAASIQMLAIALIPLSQIEFTKILVGLSAIAGALAIFILSAKFAGTVIPGLTALSGALVSVGLGMLAFGGGLALAVSAITALIVLIKAGKILDTVIKVAAKALPKLGELFIIGLETIVKGVALILPKSFRVITDGMLEGLENMLKVIQKHGKKLGKVGSNALIEFIKGIKKKVPALVNQGFILLTKFAIGLSEAVDKNKKKVEKVFAKLGLAMATGIVSGIKGIKKGIKQIGKRAMKQGWFKSMVEGLGDTILAFEDFFTDLKDTVTAKLQALKDIGEFIGTAIKDGLVNGLTNIKDKVVGVATTIKDGFCDFFGIHSPSTVFKDIGKALMDGLGIGIKENKKNPEKEAKDASKDVTEAAKSETSNAAVTESNSASESKTKEAKKVSKAEQAWKDYSKTVKDAVKGASEMFEAFDNSIELTSKQMIKNLKSQITGISGWAANIDILADRGINKGLLKKLVEMGPESAKYVSTLVQMTDKEFKKLNKLYSERITLNDEAANVALNAYKNYGLKAGSAYSDGVMQGLKTIKEKTNKDTNDIYKGFVKNGTIVAGEYQNVISAFAKTTGYAKGAVEQFMNVYVPQNDNFNKTTKALKVAKTAVNAYAKSLWKTSENHKEDTKQIKAHRKILNQLLKERKETKKEIDALNDSNTKASQARVKNLQNEVKESNKLIKQAKKQIIEDTKQIAQHTKESFNEVRDAIKETVSSYINLLSIDISELDYFGNASSVAESEKNAEQLAKDNKRLEEAVLERDALNNELAKYPSNSKSDKMARNSIKSRMAALDKEIESLRSSVDSLSNTSEETAKTTASSLKKSLIDQINSYREWMNNIQSLENIASDKARGIISEDFVAYLKKQGYDAADIVKSIVNMSEEELKDLSNTFNESGKLSADQLISGFKDKMNNVQAWSETLRALLEDRGLDSKIVAKIAEMGVDEGLAYAKAINSMTDLEINALNESYADSLELPEEVADQLLASYSAAGSKSAQGFIAGLATITEKDSEENKKLKETANKVAEELKKSSKQSLKNAGMEVSGNLAEGLNSKESKKKIKNASETVAKSLIKTLKDNAKKEDGKNISANVILGMVKGLIDNDNSVKDAARKVANGALKAAAKELGVNSPSKEFMKIGGSVDEGFEKGILKDGDSVSGTASDIMGEAIKAAYSMLNGDVGNEFAITPVLDFSQIQNDMTYLNRMLESGITNPAEIQMANSATANTLSETDIALIDTMNKLQKALTNFNSQDTSDVIINNDFEINGVEDPTALANTISKEIQTQFYRRNAAWA